MPSRRLVESNLLCSFKLSLVAEKVRLSARLEEIWRGGPAVLQEPCLVKEDLAYAPQTDKTRRGASDKKLTTALSVDVSATFLRLSIRLGGASCKPLLIASMSWADVVLGRQKSLCDSASYDGPLWGFKVYF